MATEQTRLMQDAAFTIERFNLTLASSKKDIDEASMWWSKHLGSDGTSVGTLTGASRETLYYTLAGHCIDWGLHGFQVVRCGDRLAASLASTAYAGLEKVDPPWGSFAIHVNAGAVSKSDVFMLVAYRPAYTDPWVITALGDVAFRATYKTLLDDVEPFNDPIGRRFEMTCRRVVVGCMLEMLSKTSKNTRPGSSGIRMKRGLPKAHTYVLGRAVTLDLREKVCRYTAGESNTSPTVQTLVRGHYKMQVHGEGRIQRKYIHVEPYWRGPEDAPIVVRPHKLTEGE